MTGIIEFLIGYILLIVFWLIVNLFFYALSIVFKKGFFFVPFAINTLLNWAIQIYLIVYPLYILWQIIVAKEWLILILALIFGWFIIGWWQMIVGFLTAPFSGITIYFSEKAAKKLDRKEDGYEYEVLSPEGEIVRKYKSWGKTHKDFAKWFVISFCIAFIHQFQTSESNYWKGLMWYVLTPVIIIVLASIVIGLLLGIYNILKKRPFLGEDRYEFLVKILKGFSIIYGLSVVLEILLSLVV